MSRSIEERVVQMEFENESFEKKASQTKKTLQDLDKSLEFKNGRKSFEDVEAAAEKTNFKSLISAADTVTNKLSNLGIVGVTALTNLTNKAVDAGERLVKSLTTDQILAGWNKMDQITRSTGTLIAQGYDMSEVEEQLNRLNWFTDETSYNLTDMVDNISKFTATGKGLKDSATAMEGIALWAALSGQNASTASRAMFQLSQALGAGYMRLEDYKSIQNASMDTDEFRQKTLDAAVALGTLKDNADGTYSSLVGKADAFNKSQFAQSLTEGMWFTSDVMMEVFGEYSTAVDQVYEYAQKKGITASQAIEELGDKVDSFGLKAFRAGQEARTFGDAIDSVKDAVSTGWMKTFKLIFGDYNKQRVMWTDLANTMYDVFAAPGDARNEMLSAWNELGGQEGLIQGVSSVLDGVIQRIDKVKEIFGNIFPPMTAERLFQVTENFRTLSESFALSDREGQFLEGTLGSIFLIIKKLIDIVSGLTRAFSPILRLVTYFGREILDLLGSIGLVTKDLINGINFGNVFDVLEQKISSAVNAIIKAYESFWNFMHTSDGVKIAIESISKVFSKMVGKIKTSVNKLETILGPLGTFINKNVIDPLQNFVKSILSTKKPIQIFKDALKNLNSLFGKLKSGFSNLTGVDFSKWSKSISDAVKTIKDKLEGLAKFILGQKETLSFTDILGTAGAIGAIVAVQKISDAFSKVGTLADTIKASFSSLNNIFKAKQLSGFTKNFDAIAKSVALLAASLMILTFIDEKDLARVTIVLGALAVVVSGLSLTMGILSKKINPKQIEVIETLSDTLWKMSTALIVVSAAVLILGKSGVVDTWKKTFTTITLIAALAATLGGLALLLSLIKSKLSVGLISILAISAAIVLMTTGISKLIKTVKMLSNEDIRTINENLVTILLVITSVIERGRTRSLYVRNI